MEQGRHRDLYRIEGHLGLSEFPRVAGTEYHKLGSLK